MSLFERKDRPPRTEGSLSVLANQARGLTYHFGVGSEGNHKIRITPLREVNVAGIKIKCQVAEEVPDKSFGSARFEIRVLIAGKEPVMFYDIERQGLPVSEGENPDLMDCPVILRDREGVEAPNKAGIASKILLALKKSFMGFSA